MANIAGQTIIPGLGIFNHSYATPVGRSLVVLGYPLNSFSKTIGHLSKKVGNYQQCNVIATSTIYFSVVLGKPQVVYVKAFGEYSLNFRLGQYHNYWPRLARFFGANAKQDQNCLYIQKRDLPRLKASDKNTAESLFAAICLHVMYYECNSLISTIFIYLFTTEIVRVNHSKHIRFVLVLCFYSEVIYDARNQTKDYNLPLAINSIT